MPRAHHQTQLRGRGRCEQFTMFPAVGRAWVVAARRLLSVIYLASLPRDLCLSFFPRDCLVYVFSSLGYGRMRMRTGVLLLFFFRPL